MSSSVSYCEALSVDQYEESGRVETDRALQELIAHLDANPDDYYKILRRKQQDLEERSGLLSYIKIMRRLRLKSAIDDAECEERLSELKTGILMAHASAKRCKNLRSNRLFNKLQKPLIRKKFSANGSIRNEADDQEVYAVPYIDDVSDSSPKRATAGDGTGCLDESAAAEKRAPIATAEKSIEEDSSMASVEIHKAHDGKENVRPAGKRPSAFAIDTTEPEVKLRRLGSDSSLTKAQTQSVIDPFNRLCSVRRPVRRSPALNISQLRRPPLRPEPSTPSTWSFKVAESPEPFGKSVMKFFDDTLRGFSSPFCKQQPLQKRSEDRGTVV